MTIKSGVGFTPYPDETQVFDSLVYFVKRNDEWYISDVLPTMTIHTYDEVSIMEYQPRDEWAAMARMAYTYMFRYSKSELHYAIQLYITDNSNCLDGYEEKLAENTVKVLQGVSPDDYETPVPFRNYESYMAPYQSVQIRYRDALRGQQKPTDLPIKTTTTYIPGMYEEELFQSEKPDHNSATFINYSLPLSGKANIKNLVQNGLDNYNAPFFASPKETPLYKCKIPLTKSCLIKFNSKEDAQKIVDMFKEE